MLGRGGMAVVALAHDERLDTEVALKLTDRRADPEVVSRFVAEARATARLRHPHIVTVHDAGTDGPWLYIAMELLEGGTARDRVDDGALPAEEAVRIADEALAALEVAHAAGVVHRDVKPRNLLLDRRGRCKLADFGIARLAEAEELGLTETGSHLGTLAYMAPEQHADAKSVDARADLYGVGATLYHLVTGETPFALHQRELHAQRLAPVPPALRPVIETACRFQPEDRYPSARAMRDALAEAAAHLDEEVEEPEVPAPPPPPPPPPAPSRRGPWLGIASGLAVGLACVFGCAGVVGTGVLLWRTPTEPARSVAPAVPPEPAPVSVAPAPPPPLPPPEAVPPPVVAPPPAAPRPAPSPTPVPRSTLLVNSLPPADLSVDGRDVGRTPWSGEVDVGSHVLRFTDAAGAVSERVLELAPGEELRFCWDLRAAAPCRRR